MTMMRGFFEPGDWVVVSYHEDPNVRHARLIISWAAEDNYAILTPDKDLYIEELKVPPLSMVRNMPSSRSYRKAPDMYTFDDGPHEVPSVCEFRMFQLEMEKEVEEV